MKKFDIPLFYRSPIISELKVKRKLNDPRKKDFSPSILDFGKLKFFIPRHFGFCYGVENAIEIAYKAINENPGKRIFLLSEMIHNPDVNSDLLSRGVRFLQDTSGNQLISFDTLKEEDIVVIPAFGTTLEIEQKIKSIGVCVEKYNTTCPFVEKVWNRSEKLGVDQHTIIVHGKYNHEETRATFSRSAKNAHVLILKDIEEAKFLAQVINGEKTSEEFHVFFKGKYTENFNPAVNLEKIGVVNQTTMLATETQEIADFLRQTMIAKFGESTIKNHIADTRDTLCYATNDNQSANLELLNVSADFAIVVGGHNSSNTTHLVEILETKFPTYFIETAQELLSDTRIQSFDIHQKKLVEFKDYMSLNNGTLSVIVTSGASCPDAIVDKVIQRLISFVKPTVTIEEAFIQFSTRLSIQD